jgi:hypothetical protein
MPLSVFDMIDSVMTRPARCVVASGGRVLDTSGRCALWADLLAKRKRSEENIHV